MTDHESSLGKILGLPTKLVFRIRQRGIRDAAGWCWYQIAWRFREWRLGAATREFAHGLVVGDEGECHGYEPIDYKVFDQLMDYLQPISHSDGFIDYGCGMGRAVILAAGHPYGHVIGLEIDPNLSAIAQQNLSIVSKKGFVHATNVEILTEDATHFAIPPTINHVFLFNSFTGDLLVATLNRIRESVNQYPRSLKICYLQPNTDQDPLQSFAWLELERELPTGYWLHIRSRVYIVKQG